MEPDCDSLCPYQFMDDGERRVEIIAADDQKQITAVFAGYLTFHPASKRACLEGEMLMPLAL